MPAESTVAVMTGTLQRFGEKEEEKEGLRGERKKGGSAPETAAGLDEENQECSVLA